MEKSQALSYLSHVFQEQFVSKSRYHRKTIRELVAICPTFKKYSTTLDTEDIIKKTTVNGLALSTLTRDNKFLCLDVPLMWGDTLKIGKSVITITPNLLKGLRGTIKEKEYYALSAS